MASRVIRGEAVFLASQSRPTDFKQLDVCEQLVGGFGSPSSLQHQVIRSEGWPEGRSGLPRLPASAPLPIWCQSSWRSSHPRSETARPSAHTHDVYGQTNSAPAGSSQPAMRESQPLVIANVLEHLDGDDPVEARAGVEHVDVGSRGALARRIQSRRRG